MKTLTLVLLFASLHAFADPIQPHYPRILSCSFDQFSFVVGTADGRTVSTPTESGSTRATCDAGSDIAIGFDGFSAMAFDGTTFNTQNIMSASDEQAAIFSQTSAGLGLAALYSGKEFVVYDTTRRAFFSNIANEASQFAKVSAGEFVAILYDGEDIQIYNRTSGLFVRDFAGSSFEFSAAIAGRDNAAAFDGEYAVFYCGTSNTFTRVWIGTDHTLRAAFPFLSPGGEQVGLFIGPNLVLMNADCSVNTVYAPPR